MEFTTEQHTTWETLYRRQSPNVREHACSEFLVGFDELELPACSIPTLDHLNGRITPATGWKIKRTETRYSDALAWYREFDRRNFLITDYMRGPDELEFTPEPDMFHDVYGHLPFMMIPAYTEVLELFAPAFLRADEEQREVIKRLNWYTIEFGLKRERGEVKVFGAGLLSSYSETLHVYTGETPILPLDIATIAGLEKAIYEFNRQLFIIEDLQELKDKLSAYFDTIG